MDETSAAVERLYRAEALKLWRALVGFTGDREIADDAVAEAFARALHHAGVIRDPSAWIWRVAFRVATKQFALREQVLQIDSVVGKELSAEIPDLVRALRHLPTKQRQAIVMHDYADRPTAEVAAILGCSRATVHVHLSKGRHRLRELLEVVDA
ncbi:MAG: polymerase sigma-70 factor, subfamily [Actinomycetota bacterium]|nr:polymerase sigma-70 factor, subfamily [Actinomycetota bacterium]